MVHEARRKEARCCQLQPWQPEHPPNPRTQLPSPQGWGGVGWLEDDNFPSELGEQVTSAIQVMLQLKLLQNSAQTPSPSRSSGPGQSLVSSRLGAQPRPGAVRPRAVSRMPWFLLKGRARVSEIPPEPRASPDPEQRA